MSRELCNVDGGQGGYDPAAGLHAGMFRERTIQEVRRVLLVLQRHTAPGAATAEVKSVNEIVGALGELEDFCVDREVLERTSVGKEVRKLQRYPDPRITKRAEALCEQWKKDFEVRKKVVEGFMEKGALKKRDARELEEGLFNSWCPLGILEGEGYDLYKTHYKRLCTHLRTKGPGSLAQRLQDSKISFADAAALPDDELMSNEKRQQVRAAEEEGLRAALATSAEPEGTVTDLYTCPRCQCTRTSYVEMQTGWHSDQQDMTILARCLNCGYRWKASDDHGLAGS